MSFFDEYNMPNPTSGEKSTNGIVFLVTLMFLEEMMGRAPDRSSDFIKACIAMENDERGLFAQTPWTTYDIDMASWDNILAIGCGSHRYGFTIHERIKLSPYFIYFERAFIMLGLLKNSFWAWLLMPISSAAMIFTCWRMRLANNGVIDTDGKILAWMKMNTIKMPTTWRICTYLINKNFGHWGNVLLTYHRVEGMPVRDIVLRLEAKGTNWYLF